MPEALLSPPAVLTLAELVSQAHRLQQAGQAAAAVALYQRWVVDGPLAMRHVAWFNLGTLLGGLNRNADA